MDKVGNLKEKCARMAYEMIEDGMTVGLGGGSTVALLIQELKQHPKNIWAVTPSYDTQVLCIRHGIPVLLPEMVSSADLAFDGCDELDWQLNALKSCGGIHTREKIVAAMAEEYILLADQGKYFPELAFAHPVTVEAVCSAKEYVKKALTELGADVTERRSPLKTGLLVSDDGNYLFDAVFPQGTDAGQLNDRLNAIPGLVGHALFYGVAAKAILAGENGVEVVGPGRE